MKKYLKDNFQKVNNYQIVDDIYNLIVLATSVSNTLRWE